MKKGLTMIFTGDGKGKTTSALGLALRAYGNNLRVLILQFIKGSRNYGELDAIKKLQKIDNRIIIKQCGEGFIKRKDFNLHKLSAQNALNEAKDALTNKNWDMIILDEILYCVKFGLLEENEILEIMNLKPEYIHLVLTGRGASDSIIKKADLVSDIKCVKHPFQEGIEAQTGIEF